MSEALDNVARQPSDWLRPGGPLHEIVISTRIRLARNIRGFLFLPRADAEMRGDIAKTVRSAAERIELLREVIYVDVEGLDELHRQLLVERHLISRQHADGTGARGVVFRTDEAMGVMINEEDHLRIQVMRNGLQVEEAWEQINAIDDALEQQLDFEFHPQYGYLTACPTNVGTGIRVSVMLHLPALRLTNELEKVGNAARDMKLAVRGLHGEGSEATGDFFQISNQVTLGKSETEIVDDFSHVVIPKIVDYEKAARHALIKGRPHAMDDKIWRAISQLRSARLMSSEEALQYLSHVRMGLHTGRLGDINLQTLNELFLQVQPAHLQKIRGERLTGEQRSIERATFIRSRLNQN